MEVGLIFVALCLAAWGFYLAGRNAGYAEAKRDLQLFKRLF